MNSRQLDHMVVLTHDMDTAVKAYRRMGFFITERMYHPFGTENNLIMFGNNFIEILGVSDLKKLTGIGQIINQLLQQRQGVSHFALLSNDAINDHKEFSEKGLKPADVAGFERDVVLPNGEEINAVVSVCVPHQNDTPRVLVFVCQQHVQKAIWVPEWQTHENGALGVHSITIISQAPQEDFGKLFAALLGEENVSHTQDCLTANTPNGTIFVRTPWSYRQIFPDMNLLLEESFPYVASLAIKIKSTKILQKILRKNEVDFSVSDRCTTVVSPHNANNVMIEFVG